MAKNKKEKLKQQVVANGNQTTTVIIAGKPIVVGLNAYINNRLKRANGV